MTKKEFQHGLRGERVYNVEMEMVNTDLLWMRQYLDNCEIHRQTDRHLALFQIGHVRLGQDRTGKVRSGLVRTSQERSGQVRKGLEKLGQVKAA